MDPRGRWDSICLPGLKNIREQKVGKGQVICMRDFATDFKDIIT